MIAVFWYTLTFAGLLVALLFARPPLPRLRVFLAGTGILINGVVAGMTQSADYAADLFTREISNIFPCSLRLLRRCLTFLRVARLPWRCAGPIAVWGQGPW